MVRSSGSHPLSITKAGGKDISDCKLCAWLCKWACGNDAGEFNRWLWKQSDDLERTSTGNLWEKEPNKERATQVYTIRQNDPDAAHPMLIDLAEKGSPWAMETLAVDYESGRDVALDLTQAMQWYHRAVCAGSWFATIGYARVLTKLGYHKECDAVLEDGANKGYIPAYFWLAWYRLKLSKSRKTYRKVQPLLEKAASEGHLAAQRFLALYMARGRFGLRHVPHGIKLFRTFLSTASEDWEAQKRLGTEAHNGHDRGEE